MSLKWSLNKKLGCGLTGGGCLIVLLIPFLLFAVHNWIYRPYDLPSESELKQGYATEFLSPPPPGVQVLKARQIVIWDSGCQYLLMRMTPEEIDRHIAKGFQRLQNPPDDFRDLGQANRPDWWKMPLSGSPEYYQNLSWTKEGNWGNAAAFMAVDRATGTVWLCCEKS